jgi:hypothetical protein
MRQERERSPSGRQEVGDDREARSVLQPGGAAGRFGLLDRQEVPGDWAINLRGVVKSDNGFIAVVTNNLNKAYFCGKTIPCSTATW